MNLKVGDKVRIKDNVRECKHGYNVFTLSCKGKIGTITSINGSLIRLDVDGEAWNWSENVLELINDVKMKRIDYILNAKDNIQAILDETVLDCGLCPGYRKDRKDRKDCDGDCEFYYKKYLNEEIEVDKSKLKLVEDKKNCKDCDYFVKSSLGNYCDFYGILLNIMHGCNEFQLKKHKEGIEDIKTKNIENDTINPFMEEYKKIVTETMDLCEKKNKDYGSSVQDTFLRFGDLSYLTRITDKYNRILTLINKDNEVKDENLIDTIRDMGNYCFLWLASKRLGDRGDKNE